MSQCWRSAHRPGRSGRWVRRSWRSPSCPGAGRRWMCRSCAAWGRLHCGARRRSGGRPNTRWQMTTCRECYINTQFGKSVRTARQVWDSQVIPCRQNDNTSGAVDACAVSAITGTRMTSSQQISAEAGDAYLPLRELGGGANVGSHAAGFQEGGNVTHAWLQLRTHKLNSIRVDVHATCDQVVAAAEEQGDDQHQMATGRAARQRTRRHSRLLSPWVSTKPGVGQPNLHWPVGA